MPMEQPGSGSMTLFQATLVPHRSLSPRGACWLVAVLVAVGLAVAIRFWLMGAWPVIGFSAAESTLAVGLLYLNIRRARASELVLLREDVLQVVRTDHNGLRRERVLPAAWLNVVLEEAPGRIPRLWLASHAGREEIGTSLGADEKRDLAQALREALHRARNPRFDNPQLRD